MNRILKSEFLKWRGSLALKLVLILIIIQLLTIPLYLHFSRNLALMENIIFLPMLGYCILVSIFSILLYEQEEKANHFQNIKSERYKATIWGIKLLVTDLFLGLLSIPVWVVVGVDLNQLSYYVYIGLVSWLLLILLNHFHMLLSLFIGKVGNLVISFTECLFILFATNKVFLDSFWLPIVLPVNLILEYGGTKIFMVATSLISYIVVLYAGNLVYIHKFEIQSS